MPAGSRGQGFSTPQVSSQEARAQASPGGATGCPCAGPVPVLALKVPSKHGRQVTLLPGQAPGSEPGNDEVIRALSGDPGAGRLQSNGPQCRLRPGEPMTRQPVCCCQRETVRREAQA